MTAAVDNPVYARVSTKNEKAHHRRELSTASMAGCWSSAPATD